MIVLILYMSFIKDFAFSVALLRLPVLMSFPLTIVLSPILYPPSSLALLTPGNTISFLNGRQNPISCSNAFDSISR